MEYTIMELIEWDRSIWQLAAELGLNCYQQDFELIGYNDMLAYEAYVGMPSRYPHWSFGKAYEKQKTLYKYNFIGLPYEMVINSDPCLAYLMKENTLLLQILTMAHVYGHNDFFKNNRLFKEGTQAKDAIEMFKRHGDMIRSYTKDPSIGYDGVERVLDAAHSIKLQISRVVGEKRLSEEEKKNRLLKEYTDRTEAVSILEPYKKPEPPDLYKLPLEPEDDLLLFIMKYGRLGEWEKTILDVVRQEAAYFVPQIETKIMNEGWASYWHYQILNMLKLPPSLQYEFIKRHNDVIAPVRGGLNPYYMGFKLFMDIEKKYGRDKIFEVRMLERDESFIRRYLTEELCKELSLFEYALRGGDYVVTEVSDERGWTEVRNSLCNSCGMNSVPLIRVKDMSSKDQTLVLEHVFDGRELQLQYAESTLKYVGELWGRKVKLHTAMDDKEVTLLYDENKKISQQ